MVDFSLLLKKPSGMALKPQALPPETYPGVIKSFEVGDNNKNKTPYVRLHCGLTGWPDSIDADGRSQKAPDGTVKAIDLSKRSMRRDMYLTDDALWRLDELLRALGIEGVGQKQYEELLLELVGKQVMIEVQQYLNQQTNEIGNQIGGIVAVA